MSKICIKCNIAKDLNGFRGKRNDCKSCEIALSSERFKTKDGIITRIYSDQKTSSKRRNHRLPEYTRKELKEWLFSQQEFHELFNEWKQSGFNKRLKPSVDRINDYIHYCFSNIQLMTWGENFKKSNIDIKTGVNTKGTKPVICFNKSNNEMKTFFSVSEAYRVTGVDTRRISDCCSGKILEAGGFLWEYNPDTKDNK